MPYCITKDATNIWYEVSGNETGESLLLVSGQGLDHSFWDNLKGSFETNYRVIVYDQRGTGKSDKPTEPAYSTRLFATDAIAVLDALDIPKAHVYGHSMGGRISQWLGIDYSDRILSLILASTTPGNKHGIPRADHADEVFRHLPTDPDEIITALGGLFFSKAWLARNRQMVREIFMTHPLPAHARQMHYAASEQHDAFDHLASITVPTLILHGDSDVMNPVENARILTTRILGSELHIIPGGGHGVILEFKDEVDPIILAFLMRHSQKNA